MVRRRPTTNQTKRTNPPKKGLAPGRGRVLRVQARNTEENTSDESAANSKSNDVSDNRGGKCGLNGTGGCEV